MEGQSDPLFAPANLLILTPRPSIEIPAQDFFCKKYKERVEWLPQPVRLIKICTDAGFLKTVETILTRGSEFLMDCTSWSQT